MSERVPEEVLWDFFRGAMMTKALAIVADLGIAEALADGPRAVDELARGAEVDPDALLRLLRALASDGVFAEEEPGVFRLTEPAQLLLRPGWKAFAHLFGGVFYRSVADLDRAARTGSETFPEAFGEEFWPWLGARAEERSVFDRAMAEGKERKAERLSNVEWRAGETVVDVGGGNGTLLFEVLGGMSGRARDRVRPAGDGPRRRLVRRQRRVRRRKLLRARAGGRCVRAVRDPPRLGRRARECDPAHDPFGGAAWCATLGRGERHPARERPQRREVARPLDARARGRPRADGGGVAGLLEGAGFEPVAIEDGLIEARCR